LSDASQASKQNRYKNLFSLPGSSWSTVKQENGKQIDVER
jgi:hypothetical protein